MGTPLGKGEIEFYKWAEDVGKAVLVRRRGRVFHVSGVDVALFPISVMAEAISRDVKTLRRWEREKKWPKPLWQVPDRRCKRWYSATQIMALHKLHNEASKGDWGFSHSRHFNLIKFLAAVRGLFFQCDSAIVQGTKGATNVVK